MARYLVTGGAGFIGSNIVKCLVEAGHEVTVLDNLQSGYLQNLSPFPQICFIQGDIRDLRTVENAMRDVEVVFHLAASVGNLRSLEYPIDDAEINVLGTLRVLDVARKYKVRKIVFSSSAAVFGELKTLPIREDHPVEPTSPYGVSKLAAEKLCLVYSALYAPLECICLRYFNVYGINQRYDAYGNVIPIFAYRILRGMPITVFGDGEQTRDFVNVQDVVQANIKAALVYGVSGVFNIGSGSRITINQLVELMRNASGMPIRVQYALPRKGDVRHSLADISAASRTFGYMPSVSLEDGLREYITWMKGEITK